MCMNSETVEALHAVTSELRDTNAMRDAWIADYNVRNGDDVSENGYSALDITRAEAELIFKNRRDAIEAKLKERGWSRTIRVEPVMDKAA